MGTAIPDIIPDIVPDIVPDKSAVTGDSKRKPKASAIEPAARVNGVQLIFPTNSTDEYPVSEKQLGRYVDLYPGIRVPEEMLKMLGWLESNPKRRKTTRGMPAFIASWLSNTRPRINDPAVKKNKDTVYASEEDFYGK